MDVKTLSFCLAQKQGFAEMHSASESARGSLARELQRLKEGHESGREPLILMHLVSRESCGEEREMREWKEVAVKKTVRELESRRRRVLLCGNSQCSRQIRNKKTAAGRNVEKMRSRRYGNEPESNGGSKPSDSIGWRLITQ